MTERSAQQSTEELRSAPAANRRASLQDITSKQSLRKQLYRPESRSEYTIHFIARLFCLGAAGFSLWHWRGPLLFFIIYGIATGDINPREVVGAMLQRHSSQNDEMDEQH